MSKYLRLTTPASGVTVLALARPKQKNAFNMELYRDLTRQLNALSASEDPSTKALVITGDGDYYSSGNDLANFSKVMHPKTMAKEAKHICYDFVDAFVSCRKPIVCAANGPAIGIAVTTMGLCDVRLAKPHATFHTPFKALGQAPEGCSSYMFPRLVGPDMAKELLDGGRKLTASEALQCGFISEIVPADQDIVAVAVAKAMDPNLKRFTLSEEGLVQRLREVNQREVDVLERAWISRECFSALSEYLMSRNKSGPAMVLKGLNATRWIWDR